MRIPRKRKLDKYLGYLLIGIFLPLTRLLGILLRRKHDTSKPPKYILFIKLMGLGSLVVASDAIRAMRKQMPGTRFILLTDNNIADGIAPFALFDEVWRCRSNSFTATLTDATRFIVRSWKLERLWVADLEVYSKLTTVFALFTLAVNRFGFALSPVFFRKYLNTHNVPFNQSILLDDNYLRMARAITGRDIHHHSTVKPRKDEYRKPYIALNNTCSDLAPERKLPAATFSHICQWILENTSYDIAILGTAEDKPANDRMIQQHPALNARQERIRNMAGAGDFRSYYDFLQEETALLVTIDSGPLHIAKQLALPTISLWGPTNPANYLRIQPGEEQRHVYHYLRLPCSPCVHRHEQLPCGGNNLCMKEITADAVTAKLQVMLRHLAAPVPA